MDKNNETLLLEIARERLTNRPGAFEKFQREFRYSSGAYHPIVARLHLDDLNDPFSGLHGAISHFDIPIEIVDLRLLRKQALIEQLIDDWAAKLPTPRPLKVQSLPALPGAVVAVSETPAAAEPSLKLRKPQAVEPAPGVGDSASNAPTVKETPSERRARWLAMFEAEEKREKRGALQRLADHEDFDRSNMGKAIKKAKEERDTQSRAGEWTSQFVHDGKRKG